MNRLLTANFARIKRSKLFWILCGIIFVFSVLLLPSVFIGRIDSIDVAMVVFVIPAEIACAIFISLFFGADYSDGTIRNKLIVGHSRWKIFVANSLTSVICALVFMAFYVAPFVIIGFPCLGLPTAETFKTLIVGILTLFSFCTIYTMFSMMFENKAVTTVINLLFAFILLISGILLFCFLMQPEFIPSYNTDGGYVEIPNPDYITGAARTVLKIILNILPGGQAIQFIFGAVSPLYVLPIYSFGICALCTAVGMMVFEKKNIK